MSEMLPASLLRISFAIVILVTGAGPYLHAQSESETEQEVAASTSVVQEPDYADMVDESVLGSTPRPEDTDLVTPEGMPLFGKWMVTPLFKRANWLGVRYKNKILCEPVNIIISDAYARTPEEAYGRFLEAAKKAGFPSRWGHSTGYLAFIAGAFRTRLEGKKHHAFSDASWNKANNHGRIFGPVFFNGKYWFAAAFSRQNVNLLRRVRHRYVSFNEARDRFAWAMNDATPYKVSRFIPMENAIIDSDKESTGDHDGLAVFLEAVK